MRFSFSTLALVLALEGAASTCPVDNRVVVAPGGGSGDIRTCLPPTPSLFVFGGPETPVVTRINGRVVSHRLVATPFPDMMRLDVDLISGPLDVDTISTDGQHARDRYAVRSDCRVDHTIHSIVASAGADELFIDSDALFYRIEWSTGQVHRWWREGLTHGLPRGYLHPRVRIVGMFVDGTESVMYDELTPPAARTAIATWTAWGALVALFAAAMIARLAIR